MKMIPLADRRTIDLSDMGRKAAVAEIMTGVAKPVEVVGWKVAVAEMTITGVAEPLEVEVDLAEMVEVDLVGEISVANEMLERVDMACGDREPLV